ncbi:tRNA(adenine34) deaminase [Neopestalotiopsis sp. 37M]|nr:tRNA(adenine34) deaminase [Neopestalotiopsis sp. 37M]
MAGHKISGYILSLWQVLFATLRKVYTRLFRFIFFWGNSSSNKTTTNNNKTLPDQQQQPAVGSNESTSAAALESAPETTPSALPGNSDRQATLPSSANAPNPSPATTATATAPPSHLSNPPDLEEGDAPSEEQNQRHFSQQEQQLDEEMAKRSNKRPAVKANGSQPVGTVANTSDAQQRDKENMGPGKPLNQAITSSSSVLTESNKVPLGTSGQFNTADTRGTLQQSDSQKLNGARSSSGISVQPSPSTVSSIPNNRTDSARGTLTAAESQTPVEMSVTPTERKSEKLGAGSHSQVGAQDPDSVRIDDSTVGKKDENATLDAQMNQAAAAIGRLAIDDNTPGPEKALTKDTAAVEAAGVPVVAANANPGQPLIALKPLAPLVTPPSQVLPGLIEPDTEEGKRERAIHLNFMREALAMGDAALTINETPVGCVLVYRNRIIAKGMNATNITRNGTRHAEFMALSALLSHQSDADVKDVADHDDALWGDVDPADGHIFPYGQKLHPSPKVDRSIISECILYVTVEPCVMCASLLRQLRIKKVYFGAVNDKFGGTGGVFRIHINSKPVVKNSNDKPYQASFTPQEIERAASQRGRAAMVPREDDDGDGGNVEPGYPAEGGFLRDEAVSLLRRFYVQENGRAPQPRKKEGRAARLFAMENAAANGGVVMTDADGNIIHDVSGTGTPTPVDGETTPVIAA